MADDERQAAAAAQAEEEEADVGPSLPPEGLEGGEEEEEGADVGPIMPKPKKRKVGGLPRSAGGWLMRQSAGVATGGSSGCLLKLSNRTICCAALVFGSAGAGV